MNIDSCLKYQMLFSCFTILISNFICKIVKLKKVLRTIRQSSQGQRQERPIPYRKSLQKLNDQSKKSKIEGPLVDIFSAGVQYSQQNYHKTIILPQMQEVSYPYLNCRVIVALLVLTVVTYSFYLKLQFKKRMSVLRSRTPEEIPSNKIIIAIEPNQLFFKLSNTAKPGWRQVILRDETEASIWGCLTSVFKKKIYYRLNHEKTEIYNFVQALSQNNKIQLYLYTSASLQIAEFVFKQLGILKYFPEHFRISYNGSDHSKMHAVEVDSQTNRVIIFTGSKTDYEEEYSKYFLVMRKRDKNLCKVGKKMIRLVNLNEDIDELHNQLNVLKINVQSESEGCGQTY